MTKRPILTLKSSRKRKHLSSNDQIKINNLVEQQQKNIDDQSSQPKKAEKDPKTNNKAKKQFLISDEDYFAIISYMQENFPKCFTGKNILPLALGIHNQIFALNDLQFSRRKIRQFLRRYTNSKEYRKTLIAGNERYDLHGQPTTKILEDEVYTRKSDQPKAQKKADNINKANHDSLIKKVMENPIAVTEFLDEFLPTEFKEQLDLGSLKVEKESYVEDSLKTRFSDIVYSVQTKAEQTSEPEKAFVYMLLEHMSSSDHFIAFRLWKYSLLLLERHAKKKNKLPIILPIILYNGKNKYTAPKNIWELFSYPALAKKAIAEDYQLINLNEMSDDDIDYEKHLSFVLYTMKHIHDRDTLKMLKNAMQKCTKALIIDKGKDYVHTKLILWYTDSKVPAENKQLLEQLIVDNLPKEDTDNIMRTIADTYIEEGIAIGEARGVEKGATNKIVEIARRMLQEKTDIKFISSVTGLSSDEVLKIQNKI